MLNTILPKNEKNNSQGVSPLMAGLAGIVVGAAGITALALSDKEIRKKVGKRASELRINLQNWSTTKLHEYKENGKKKTEKALDESTETETLLAIEEEKLHN